MVIIWTVKDESHPLQEYILKFQSNMRRSHHLIEYMMNVTSFPITFQSCERSYGGARYYQSKIKYNLMPLDGIGFILNDWIHLYVGPNTHYALPVQTVGIRTAFHIWFNKRVEW